MTLRNKRNQQKLAIAQRRQTVARLISQGLTQMEIAEQLSVAQSTVSADVQAAIDQYVIQCAAPIEEVFARELLRLDELEAEAWRTHKLLERAEPKMFSIFLAIQIQRAKLLGLTESPRVSFKRVNQNERSVFESQSLEAMAKLLEQKEANGLVLEAQTP